MTKKILKGISWNHTRGFSPLQAGAQRYQELHPDVEIQWEKRSLQEFADYPIEELTKQYDLLIIDHPWVGCAAATHCVLPLDEFISAGYLQDQQENSVGRSHESYQYEGHQWALAIDAATPVASYRKDLFEKNNIQLPTNWDELIALAATGRVAVPAIPIDVLMSFYSFCIAEGQAPFAKEEEVIDTATGIAAINTMKSLYGAIDKHFYSKNPIAVAELMASSDQYWYCPFAYCYSNYSRDGYSKNLLHYTDVVSVKGEKLSTTIGGTGLSVSAFSQHKEIAVDFASMIVSGNYQRTQYVQHGGQPGHLSAWKDETANRLTHDFFDTILPVMERGYIRPRYKGYLHFQDHAGLPLQQCLFYDGDPAAALAAMNKIYQESLAIKQSLISV